MLEEYATSAYVCAGFEGFIPPTLAVWELKTDVEN